MARLSHSTPDTQFREGSSLQAGLYARTPVQSDCCALSGNYRLESNPKDTPKRHWQQPLVTGLAERVNVGDATEFLKWWPNYGYTGRTVFGICALLKPVTLG